MCKIEIQLVIQKTNNLRNIPKSKTKCKKNCDLKKYVVQIFLLDAQKSSKIFVSRKFFC